MPASSVRSSRYEQVGGSAAAVRGARAGAGRRGDHRGRQQDHLLPHALRRALRPRGGAHRVCPVAPGDAVRARLTDVVVQKMRSDFPALNVDQIAKKYGVSWPTAKRALGIESVKQGKKHGKRKAADNGR